MRGEQLSFINELFPDEQKSIVAIVERPNGTTFEQEIQLKNNETPEQAVKNYQKRLGEPYGWKTERGKKLRYLKKDAYLVIDWHAK